MPRGRPKKAATAAATHPAEGAGLLPSPMPRRGRSAGLASLNTDNEEDPGSSSIEQAPVTPRRRGRPPKQSTAATPRGRGRPPKQPKAEKSATEGQSGEGYEADVSNLTSDIANDGVTAPTTVVDEADTSTVASVGSDIATDVVETATVAKRRRGRPPKNSTPAAHATAPTPTTTSVISKPAGRGRGRPPKNASGKATASGSKVVADNNEELEGSDEPHAVPFSLGNLVGSYTVECPKIEDTWPESLVDGDVHENTLDISPAKDGETTLAASFRFSAVAVTCHLALTKSELDDFLYEEEQATICPPSSQPSEGEGTKGGTAETNETQHDDDKNAGNIDADAEVQVVAGQKRKATNTVEPAKRGRGRPPKKAKIVHAPAPILPPKVFFAYRFKTNLGYGESNYEPRFGTIQPDDNSGNMLKGTFDIMPLIDERIDFSATKVDDKPGNESELGKESDIVDN